MSNVKGFYPPHMKRRAEMMRAVGMIEPLGTVSYSTCIRRGRHDLAKLEAHKAMMERLSGDSSLTLASLEHAKAIGATAASLIALAPLSDTGYRLVPILDITNEMIACPHVPSRIVVRIEGGKEAAVQPNAWVVLSTESVKAAA